MTDILNKEKILEHAKKLSSEGKFDRAIVEYEKILQLEPDDLRVKIKIAELYVKRKQIQNAIKLYTEVATKYAEGGFFLKAVTVYKSILRLNPSLIDVNIALSELYEKMGLVTDALYQYNIVSTSLEQKNDIDGMLNIRERMVALDPENISLRVRLAETYQLQGLTDKSIDMYEALAAQVKKSGGKNDQLIELYTKILSHRPEKNELVKELCNMYFKRGEWKEILKRMDLAKAFVAGDPELLAMQADIYSRLNQFETAKGKYYDLSELLNSQDDKEGAIKALENVLFLSPDDEEGVSAKAEELENGGFAALKGRVEDRRKRQADEDAKKEEESKMREEAIAKGEEEAKKLGMTPGEITIGQPEAVDLERQANAAYDLGELYKKTFLEDEAKKEFEKALKIYKRLSLSGYANQKIMARLQQLEGNEPTVEQKVNIKPFEKPKPKTPKETKEPPQNNNKKRFSFV